MRAAAHAAENNRAMVWYGAMLPHLKKPPTFDAFVRPKLRAQRQSAEVMQAMCSALAAAWGAVKE